MFFHQWLASGVLGLLLLASCVSTNAPPGVPRGISFGVTPVFPHSYDIVASGSASFDENEIRDAWWKKAYQVAGGHHFTVKPPMVRQVEVNGGGIPSFFRTATGTITLND